ncbi:hypothetical protein FHT97_005919 [Rhizobium sp. BK399]|nr:hypothetical protein [Rhizobium sp. BK399]
MMCFSCCCSNKYQQGKDKPHRIPPQISIRRQYLILLLSKVWLKYSSLSSRSVKSKSRANGGLRPSCLVRTRNFALGETTTSHRRKRHRNSPSLVREHGLVPKDVQSRVTLAADRQTVMIAALVVSAAILAFGVNALIGS